MLVYSDLLISLQKSLKQATSEATDGVIKVNSESIFVLTPTNDMRSSFSGAVAFSFVTNPGIQVIPNEVVLTPGLWRFNWSGSVGDNVGGATQARVTLLRGNAVDVLWSFIYLIGNVPSHFNGHVEPASYPEGAVLRVSTVGTPIIGQFCSVNGTKIL